MFSKKQASRRFLKDELKSSLKSRLKEWCDIEKEEINKLHI